MIQIPFTTVIWPILSTFILWFFLFGCCACVGPDKPTTKTLLWCAGLSLFVALLFPLTRYGVLVWK